MQIVANNSKISFLKTNRPRLHLILPALLNM